MERVDTNKPLSIALEEIAEEKIVPQYAGDAQRAAEELMGTDFSAEAGEAEVVAFGEADGDGGAPSES